MKAQLIGCLIVAAMLGIAQAASLKLLDPADGALLTGDAAKALAHQCSRGAPQITGMWTPNAAQLHELEMRLPKAFAKVTAKSSEKYLSSYLRQYAGFIIGGEKIIYVNAFSHGIVEPPPLHQNRDFWRWDPVIVCDGGTNFFGVEYDPVSKTFSHFDFNGAI